LAWTTIRREPLLRLIWLGPSAVSIRATDDRGTTVPFDDTMGSEARRIVAGRIRQSDDDVEATIALEDATGLRAPDGGRDRLGDVGGGQAVVGCREPIDADGQGRQARRLFDPNVC
jgi:hypothetical protein